MDIVARANRANNGGGGGGGSKGQSKGGGGGGGDTDEVRKLKANAKRLEEELRKVKAQKAEEASRNADEEDAEMETDPPDKVRWERALAQAEHDLKNAEADAKKFPWEPKYRGRVEQAKYDAEDAKEQLRKLKDPLDQIRQKDERLRRLALKEEKLRNTLRENDDVITEKQEANEELRGRIHEVLEEKEKIKSERKILVLQDDPPAPVDIELCVDTVRSDLEEMFVDPALAEQAKAKKSEVEEGFIVMRNLIKTLAAMHLEYKTATSAAHASAPLAEDKGVAGVKASETGTPAVEGAETVHMDDGAAGPPAATSSAARTSLVADGPSQERSANRERTPPPSKGTTVQRKTDEELLGPRSAASKKNAGAKAAA